MTSNRATTSDGPTVTVDAPQPLESAPDPITVGSTLDRYVVVETIGSGGMGRVYRAYDPRLQREVAIKLLHEGLRGSEDQERILREAQAMAQVSHPHVLPVYDVGGGDDAVFIAMEYVRGRTLRQWLAERERSWSDVVDAFIQAGRGIAAAHAVGLVHRDFKPTNVLVGEDERVRVMDFGLARLTGVEGTGSVDSPSSSQVGPTNGGSARHALETPLTEAGTVMGTPAYMAPEQFTGKTTAASDQFSLAVALWEALYGRRPFGGKSSSERVRRIKEGRTTPIPPGRRVPRSLHGVLLRALAAEPGDRWPTVDALVTKLEGRRRRRSRVAVTGVVTGAIGFSVALGSLVDGEQPCATRPDDLDSVWNVGRAEGIRDVLIRASGEAGSTDADRVEEVVDQYLSAWHEQHRDACEDTHIRNEQSQGLLDVRMACLRHSKLEMDAVLRSLEAGGDAAMTKARRAVSAVRAPQRCAEHAYLLADVVPPSSPTEAAEAQRLRGRMAEIRAYRHLGRYSEGLQESQVVYDEASALGYDPAVAEAANALGLYLSRLGRNEEARQTFEDGHFAALRSDHVESEVYIGVQLTYLVGHTLREPELGLMWGRHAEAKIDRVSDPETEGLLYTAMGALLQTSGRLEQALGYHQRALAAWQAEFGDRTAHTGSVKSNMGGVLASLGRYDEAETMLAEAIASWETIWGPEHPDLGVPLNNLGIICHRRGKLDEARAHLERSLELRLRGQGPLNPETGSSWLNLGQLESDLGHHDRALAYALLAHQAFRDSLPLAHPWTAGSMMNLGRELAHFGDREVALAYVRAATQALEPVELESPSESLPILLVALETLTQLGEHETTQDLLARASAVAAAHEPAPEDAERLRLLRSLSRPGRRPRTDAARGRRDR